MRFALWPPLLAILSAHSAPAQSPVALENIATTRQALIPQPGERKLRCTVEPIPPVLLYTAPEVAAGFTYSIPLAPYANGMPGHGWSVVVGLTPNGDEGSAFYLSGQIGIPATNRDSIHGRWAYRMGRGTYFARLALSDDEGGVCRQEWSVNIGNWPAQPVGWAPPWQATAASYNDVDPRTRQEVSQFKLRLSTPDGTVSSLAPHAAVTAQPQAQRITVLLRAPSDLSGQLAVTDALENLLARIPAESVRLVVFSLEEGREIFRQDPFQWDALQQVEEAFASVEYRAVSVAELQTHPIATPAELLDSLVQGEARDPQRPDVVLFLGIEHGFEGKAPRLSTPVQRPVPPFYYLHLVRGRIISAGRPAIANGPVASRTPGMAAAAGLSGPVFLHPTVGPVDFVVDKLKGKTMDIYFSKEFDQALEKIRKSLQSAGH